MKSVNRPPVLFWFCIAVLFAVFVAFGGAAWVIGIMKQAPICSAFFYVPLAIWAMVELWRAVGRIKRILKAGKYLEDTK